ncbi:MAG: hypothetical protein AAF717_14665 [Bacteroidota bacterium]
MKKLLGLLLALGLFSACGDDDGFQGEIIPPRLLAEVAPENDAEILEYLSTHFYNYEDFQEPIAPDFDFKIRIDTIAGDNADKTPLSEQVSSQVIRVNSFEFGLSEEEEDIPHTLYYLIPKQGVGASPSVADSIVVRYTGSLLDGTTFDASDTGVWFDLARIQAPLQGARGFTEGAAFFNSGGDPITNPDGTFDVEGFGAGIMFIPSGLGFFNAAQGLIPAYSPLVFELNVLAMVASDHDQDGIPSILEDLNGNGYLYDDNTDEEEEEQLRIQPAVDFLDLDDDNDGIRTSEEISIDSAGNITFPDSDGDGTPDYRDPDS